MKKITARNRDGSKIRVLILVLTSSLIFSYGEVTAAEETGTDTALADIIISFKLDPRLTRGLYMGDRWVSPPRYSSTLQAGKQATVEARVYGRDSKGISVQISPEWIASDPDMVEVSIAQGGVVTITVKRAGQSRLNVVSQGFTKKLQVDATVTGNGMQVVISK